MKKSPLQPFKTYQENLLYWVKAYLAHKSLELFNKSKENKVDDIIKSLDEILMAKAFNDVQKPCSELIKSGLRSLAMPLGAMTKFHAFALNYASSLTDFNSDMIYDLSASMDLAESTKKTYLDCALELLTYIENNNMDGFKFHIEYEGVRLKKPSAKVYDAMDSEEFIRFSKELPNYKFKNEFEKCRTVLICRIMLYSGITPKELVSLKLGENLIVDKKSIYLTKLDRSVDIHLPRNKIIKYLNRYLELKEDNKNGYLFYAITNKDEMLNTIQVNDIVKTMLEHAKIKRREMNATLLRVSLAVYLYNHRTGGKHFPLTAIQAIMGQKNRADTERMIGFHAKQYVMINDAFLDEKFD